MIKKYYVNPTATRPAAIYLQDGQVYYINTSEWYALQGEPADLVDVAIAFVHNIFSLDKQGCIYRWMGAQQWQRDVTIQDVVSLTNDSTGCLWCVTKSGRVYYKSDLNAAWQFIDSDIPAKVGDQFWSYVVVQGDWLWKIVRKEYNTGSKNTVTAAIVDQIKALNPSVGNWDNLTPGMQLKMPPK